MSKILVVDIGGTNIKVKHSESDEIKKFPSGPELTPQQMVEAVHELSRGLDYDGVSIGFPGPVVHGKIQREPVNLGKGWMDFDFSVIGKPYKLINDAAMQALGSYQGGRMLFLGLGTGLGATLILDGVVAPLEVGHLPYRKGRTFEQTVGTSGMRRLGKKKWRRAVADTVDRLRRALVADYVILGGGNIKKLKELPPETRLGSNGNAFVGGVRMWDEGG